MEDNLLNGTAQEYTNNRITTLASSAFYNNTTLKKV
jgi:hypothetical protein